MFSGFEQLFFELLFKFYKPSFYIIALCHTY